MSLKVFDEISLLFSQLDGSSKRRRIKLMKVMNIDRDKNYLIDDKRLLKNATSVNMLALILVCYGQI